MTDDLIKRGLEMVQDLASDEAENADAAERVAKIAVQQGDNEAVRRAVKYAQDLRRDANAVAALLDEYERVKDERDKARESVLGWKAKVDRLRAQLERAIAPDFFVG
jgi:uncharacterized coiled-coil DUF342 family protein